MKAISLCFAFLLLIGESFGQHDSTHIYVGITVVPVAPVFHRVEDTTWYIARTSLGGSQYEELIKTHIRPAFNIASGGMLFFSFNHFLDISAGFMVDLKPYYFYRYLGGTKTWWKYYFLRPIANFKFSLFRSKPICWFFQMGVQGRYYRIGDGLIQVGIGASRIKKKISWNTQLDFNFHSEIVSGLNTSFEKSRIFPSPMLKLGVSYTIF